MGRIFSNMGRTVSAVLEPLQEITGSVFNLQRCSVHDGPGIRTTVFLKGCPLRCTWCHNPEGIESAPSMMISADLCIGCDGCRSVCPIENGGAAPAGLPWDRASCIACSSCVEACPTGARELSGSNFEVSVLIDEVEKDRPFFDASGGGVTFSGGEPLSQPRFLEAAISECRERGIHVVVDTCGFAPPETVLRIGGLADLVLFDLKHMDPTAHHRHTGVDNRLILENLQQLSASGASVWIRIPLIPGFNDDQENIDATGRFAAALPRRHPLFVLPYHGIAEGKSHRLGEGEAFSSFQTPDSQTLVAIHDRLEGHGLKVTTGGSQ